MTRRALRNVDWVMVTAVFFLLSLGLVLVYSASQVPAFPGRSSLFSRQFMWMGLGLGVMMICTVVPYRVWEEYAHVLYVASLLLLVLVPIIGVERLGAKRWIALGGFQFQPSELAKLATLLLISRMLARPRLDLRRFSVLFPILGVALLPFALILIEPDLGTSLSIPASLVPMLFWCGMPLAVILLVLAPVVSMILAVKLWVWIVFLLALGGVLIYMKLPRTLILTLVLVNLAAGAATPIIWNGLKPYQQTASPHVSRSRGGHGRGGLPGHPVPHFHRVRRGAGSRILEGNPEGVGVSPPAAHGLRVFGARRRGWIRGVRLGPHRVYRLGCPGNPACRARPKSIRQRARGGHLLRDRLSRGSEREHDLGPCPGYRDSAAVSFLRRYVPSGHLGPDGPLIQRLPPAQRGLSRRLDADSVRALPSRPRQIPPVPASRFGSSSRGWG